MSLFSPIFFLFFLVAFILYYSLKKNNQKYILFVFSLIFIASFSISLLFYVLLYVSANYIILWQIDKNRDKLAIKNSLYKTGLFLNIGSLAFFKYFNFLLGAIFDFLHIVHLPVHFTPFNIFIPLGISYYTFQGIGYLIQVNRGNEHTEKDLVLFFNYFILFPKFLSGPIEFSRKLIPQLKEHHIFQYQNVIEGFRLMLWGAFKKMVIADRLAMVINGVYPQLHSLSGNILIITFLIQPLHVYFDFSGYTDIALGIGRVFGLKLTDNFNRPFFSTGVTEFWKRWHISLTTWCNEFIFKRIMFKKRKWGVWASTYAVFMTFLVIGIWHGPRWTFIILGILQGLAINYEFFTKKSRIKIAGKLPDKLVLYGSYLITYLFVCLSMVFFYSPNLKEVNYYISHMFVNLDFTRINLFLLSFTDKIILLFSILFIFVIEFRQENGKNLFVTVNTWPNWKRKILYYSLIILIIYLGNQSKTFVYMKF